MYLYTVHLGYFPFTSSHFSKDTLWFLVTMTYFWSRCLLSNDPFFIIHFLPLFFFYTDSVHSWWRSVNSNLIWRFQLESVPVKGYFKESFGKVNIQRHSFSFFCNKKHEEWILFHSVSGHSWTKRGLHHLGFKLLRLMGVKFRETKMLQCHWPRKKRSVHLFRTNTL